MSTWKPGSRGRPPAWAIAKGLHISKTDIKSPLKTVKTMNKTASIKSSPIKKNNPIKKNTWYPGSRGRVPDWYKEVNPNWKEDNKDNVTERKYKDLVKQKQSSWTPGKPGRPPAWATDYVQKQKEDKEKDKQKTKYTWTPGKPGRPPAWAGDYVQKKNEKKAKKTQWQQPGDRGRPPLWAKDYDWY